MRNKVFFKRIFIMISIYFTLAAWFLPPYSLNSEETYNKYEHLQHCESPIYQKAPTQWIKIVNK